MEKFLRENGRDSTLYLAIKQAGSVVSIPKENSWISGWMGSQELPLYQIRLSNG